MSDYQLDMLPEHAAPEKAQKGGTYEPTDDEKKSIKLVEKLLAKSKRIKSKTDKDWMKYYKMFRGKQWFQQRPSYRHSEVLNMIWQTIQSQIPLMTDSRPRIQYVPKDPTDFAFAEILNEVIESDWEGQSWLYHLIECLYYSKFVGTFISATEYNAEAMGGIGATTYRAVDPFYFFPDPDARDVNDERCNYVVEVDFLGVDKVKAMAPEHLRDFIKADVTDFYGFDKTNIKEDRFRSPVDQQIHFEERSTDQIGENDLCMLITCYIKDNEVIEEACESEPDENGNTKTEYVQRKKYPKGRKIVIAGKVLLHDMENPYEDGEFPYERGVNYVDPGSFWGISEVEPIEGPQQTFNKIVSFSLDVLTLMGNPIWIISDDSDVDPHTLENRPGGVIEKTPGSEVQRVEGVQLQPFVMQMMDRYKGWIDDLSGNNEVSRGVADQVTAASAISALQEAARTRIRQQSRLIDLYLQPVGRHYLSRVLQFYSAPRVFRVTNDDGSFRYFKFHIEDHFDEQGDPIGEGKKAVIVRYKQDSATLKFGEDAASRREIPLLAQMDVKVSTGTSLPFAKAELKRELFDLFDRGIIDDKEVLLRSDYPNAEAVLKRMEERRAAEAQAKAGAQA